MVYTPDYHVTFCRRYRSRGQRCLCARTFGLCEELGGFREVLQDIEGGGRDEDCGESLENKYPGPPRASADAIHVVDRRREQATW